MLTTIESNIIRGLITTMKITPERYFRTLRTNTLKTVPEERIMSYVKGTFLNTTNVPQKTQLELELKNWRESVKRNSNQLDQSLMTSLRTDQNPERLVG